METHRGPFRLNRSEAKFLGVCAGIADHYDLDVTLVRVAAALATLLTFPLLLVAYLVVAMVVSSDGSQVGGRARRGETRALANGDAEAVRLRMRELDARLAAIESHVTSSGSALAREIDSLR